jgi:predicted nucleotidyltransferase component of viral defense system
MGNDLKAKVELFHLLFLEQLSLKLDKRLYALKGGCNLRFFLNSIRYSEDIDFDIHTIAVPTLEKMVSKILDSTQLKQVLASRAITIADFTTHKQTDTTQRWKVKLRLPDSAIDINTKLEFSRRNLDINVPLEQINKQIVIEYNLKPIYISHYPANMALYQKILALILRTETQARDIFDIDLLLNQGAEIQQVEFSANQLQEAVDNAQSINFSDFKSQVVSYLEPAYIEKYSDESVWETIVNNVTQYLGGFYATN